MADSTSLLKIEKIFWTGGPEAYLQHADAECLVVFAQMAKTMTREEIAKMAEAGRWRDIEMAPRGFVQFSPDAALVTYECKAKGKDGAPHHAYVSSGYVKRGESWKLAFHQQTPIG